MNDPTDLPTDRVPLGPDLKLFGGKASALLDDLPSPRPTPALSPPKPADPPVSVVVKPPVPAKGEPSAAPPAPQPRWVKEAIGNLLKPSRRKTAVAVGMVSLAAGAVVVRLLAPPTAPTLPTAAEVTAKSTEQPAALLTPNEPTPTPAVAQPTPDGILLPVATVANVGGLAMPEMPVLQPSVPAAGALTQPLPLPRIGVETAPPALPVATWPVAPPPAASYSPPAMYDPTLGPALRWFAVGPGWYQPRNPLPPTLSARVWVPTVWPESSPVARMDTAVIPAALTEQTPPTVPVAAPTVPTAPPIPTPLPAVSLIPPDSSKDKPIETPKLTVPGVVGAPAIQPALATPPVVPTIPATLPPTTDGKPAPFRDARQPDEPHRLTPGPLDPPAVPATLDLTKPSGAATVAPASATAPAAKPTPFSFDVDLYTPKAADTFDGISKLHYGDPRYGRALEAFNAERGGRLGDGKDVDVPPVWVLRQRYARFVGATAKPAADPPRDRDTNWGPAGDRTPSDAPRTFAVGPRGATFRQVAETVYGDSRQWSRIWDLNPKYRADDELPAGTVVKLPADAPRRRPTAE